jgi:CheY-like chemotaxis protein
MPSGTVLHVDDSPEMRELLKRACNKPEIGLRYVGTDDGEEALRLIAAGTGPDKLLLLLDLHMPGMSGIDVLDALKERGLQERVRAIVLSSSTDTGDRDTCLARGAMQYWVKPDDWRELLVLVKRCAELLSA